MTKPAAGSTPQRQGQDCFLPRCPVCGSAVREVLAAAAPGFGVDRCLGCGLGRTRPAMPPEDIGRWYSDSYYGRENVRFNPCFEALTRLFRRRRARVLSGRAARGPVLDVGCGRGIMLDALRRLGYEAHGQELNVNAAWHARRALGLDVATGDFFAAALEPGYYQAVIFWHSLEHFPDPAAALARARALLRPGGVLAVAVPNFDSLQARLFGRHWFHLDLPRHYFHFGTRSLQALLARHGFRVVRTDHFCLEQNPFGWLQSLYNAAGFPANLLYDLLKAPSARAGTARAHRVAGALTVISVLPLLVLALLLTILDAALRQGGTVELYAVKEKRA